ncbi:MAG: hypothetical protein AAF367_12550 [Pseudomonadota bacterium]
MRSLFIFLVLFGLSFTRPASAESHITPEMGAAIEAWLADDDATALPALGAMAAAGDRSVQLLLSQIERHTPAGGETSWVSALDDDARMSLFRTPGDPAADPWVMQLAAKGDPLAQALKASRQPDATIETAQALFAAGEVEQAKRLTWNILAGGRFDAILNLPPEEPLNEALDYVKWMQGWFLGGALSPEQRKWVLVSPKEGRMLGMVLVNMLAPVMNPALAPREPVARVTRALQGSAQDLVEEGPQGIGFVAKLLERQARTDPDLKALGNMCTRLCADEVGTCLLGSVLLLGGYERVMEQDSPYEGLIPQADYVASLRAQNTAERRLRRAVAIGFGGGTGYRVSQCLAGHMGG